MKERNNAIPAVYLFLEKDGKFLISRRCNTGYQDGTYQVPAGHVEKGELPSDALIREAYEEIGIVLEPGDFEFVHVLYKPKHDNTDNRVDFFFKAKRWKGEVKNMEPNKSDDLKWVTPDELPENTGLHILEAFKCMQKGIFYNEFGIQYLKENGLYKL